MYVIGIKHETINGPVVQLLRDSEMYDILKYTKAEADQVKLEHVCEGYPEDCILLLWLDTGDVEEKPRVLSTITVDVVSNIELFRSFVEYILQLANDPLTPNEIRLKLVDKLSILERGVSEKLSGGS